MKISETRIITIGRQFGSGGGFIGHEVAKRLGIECYDKQLIELASMYGDMNIEEVRKAEEKRANPFLYKIPREYQNERTGRGIPVNDMVFNLQSAVIKRLADKPCVIVGRCADFVLREYDNIYSVFIYADMDYRVDRISEIRQLPREQAIELVKREDKNRKKYYECYTNKRWGANESYDICLNSGNLGWKYCVGLLCERYQKINLLD